MLMREVVIPERPVPRLVSWGWLVWGPAWLVLALLPLAMLVALEWP